MSNKGLKLNNQKSSIAPPVNTNPQLEAFQKASDEAAERMADYKIKAASLGIQLKSLMESSILPENKTAMLRDLENETLQKLSQLATEINSDEVQPEGSGGVALCQLLMKMMLLQKDQISRLSYRLSELEKINKSNME